jgi:hypothetical protein|tara:strand:- start:1883 stop:2884 length:1002 start_codon:yes stop_codon:yes gene_type:complete
MQGTAAVFRQQKQNDASLDFSIESYDDVRTAQGRIALEFLDDSVLKLTEHSSIVIDEFVYDPNPSKSKLALTFASGTARFITGALGKIDKQNIKIRTPTAEVAIRGTDFTSTVDELGRTLVILLPDKFGVSSGEITVSSLGGQVSLTEAFQATTVSTAEAAPSPPKILDVTLAMIDNMLIVSPPKEVVPEEQAQQRQKKDELDFEELDKDLLEDQLEEDLLEEFQELDIDFLNVDFLVDLLDTFDDLEVQDKDELADSALFELVGTSYGFDSDTQINTFLQEQMIVLYRQTSNSVRLDLASNYGYNILLDDEGKRDSIIINSGGDSRITITQQ